MNIAYNMDCLAAMREMPGNAFDLAVVDPPYGNASTCEVGG
ncbi:MAG: site-specific DNA-methyltransferase [Parasporobacterium sp.]|nr:site-specific DNA-methyltransferase [Parasporobacterium sp.]